MGMGQNLKLMDAYGTTNVNVYVYNIYIYSINHLIIGVPVSLLLFLLLLMLLLLLLIIIINHYYYYCIDYV